MTWGWTYFHLWLNYFFNYNEITTYYAHVFLFVYLLISTSNRFFSAKPFSLCANAYGREIWDDFQALLIKKQHINSENCLCYYWVLNKSCPDTSERWYYTCSVLLYKRKSCKDGWKLPLGLLSLSLTHTLAHTQTHTHSCVKRAITRRLSSWRQM